MIICFGVHDIPYADANGDAIEERIDPDTGELMTTGQVATDLEDRYGIFEHFFGKHGSAVAEEAVQLHLDMLAGLARHTGDDVVLDGAKDLFHTFIEEKEMDGVVDGVPTQASLMGKSLRFKHKRGPIRPSFIDTGLYFANAEIWAEK